MHFQLKLIISLLAFLGCLLLSVDGELRQVQPALRPEETFKLPMLPIERKNRKHLRRSRRQLHTEPQWLEEQERQRQQLGHVRYKKRFPALDMDSDASGEACQ